MPISEAIHRIQFSLIEAISSSTKQLLAAGSVLSRPDYDDIVVERSIATLCGYPLCPNPLPVNRARHGRFRVSLREHRVYDLQDTYKYCSEACVVSSRAFSEGLRANRSSEFSEAKIEQVLRLFGDCNDVGVELGEEDVLGTKYLRIKEKGDAGVGEVSLDEWIGPANAIEGYVPQRDRIGLSGPKICPHRHSGKSIEGARDSGAPFSSRIFVGNETDKIGFKESSVKQIAANKQEENITAVKKTKRNKTASKASKVKKNFNDFGNSNKDFTSSVIVGNEFDDHGDFSITGKGVSEVLAKQLENMALEEKKGKINEGLSSPFRSKSHIKSEGATDENVNLKGINGELTDSCLGNVSSKTAVNLCVYDELPEKGSSPNVPAIKEHEYNISTEKKITSEENLPKSCLKSSGYRIGDHSVKWADEPKNTSLEDEMTIPRKSSDSSIRFASAEACAAALIQAAETVASGKAKAEDAALEAGILIFPQSPSLQGKSEEDKDILEVNRGLVKWPKKTVLSDTEMYEIYDSWHDTPPEGFNLDLSPFATMWMALFGWVNCFTLAYIYGHDESSYENFMLVDGKEYPMKVTVNDGQSLEIRQTLDGLICRILPVVVRDQRLTVPVSTLEKFMGCLLDTMSFMDAVPSFKTRQWHVIILLFIEALSIHRLPVMATHFLSGGSQLQEVLKAAQISEEEYEIMKDLVLPLSSST